MAWRALKRARSSAATCSPRKTTERPRLEPPARQSVHATLYVEPLLASRMSIASSRLPARRTFWRILELSTAASWNVAWRMIPVSPIPPQVAANRSAFSSREQRRIAPASTASSMEIKWSPKEPAPWFLPCTSEAIIPPIVTSLVPGHGREPAAGSTLSMTSARSTPASRGQNARVREMQHPIQVARGDYGRGLRLESP